METVVDRPKEKVLTYEDYLKLTDDKRYEVINGRLYEMPAPTAQHQRILISIATRFYLFASQNSSGMVLPSPVDVILSETTVVQPDILFVSKERLGMVKERVFGSPDLVVEIVSPTSYKRDRYDKFVLYERYGVKEYWLVYPEHKVVEVWCLRDGKYILHSFAVERGEVSSCVLKGFKVKVEEVLK